MTVTLTPPATGDPTAQASAPATGAALRTPVRWQLVIHLVLLVGVVIALMPFLVMVASSFKTQGDILRNPKALLLQQFTGENYTRWFSDIGIGQFFTNSIVVAVATVVGNIVFCSMVGYALAKMDFRGKKVLFALVMVTLMTPGTVTFVPLFVLVSKIGLVNTYPALILPFLVTPTGVFLMRQFMLGIPDTLLEAARIDGAGEWRIFLRVVLPLCGPPVATLSILTFLGSWNNFLWPLVAAQSADKYTLPIALTLYSKGQDATNYGLLLAGSVLVIAPIVVLFLALQRFFVQSVVSSGVK